MTIVHIERPSDLGPSVFEVFMPPPVAGLPRPTLGTFARAVVDGRLNSA
jgi:hypothetical protein